MRNDKQNLIVDLSFDFSLSIIKFSESLYAVKRFPLANQIFRSGTSIGANIKEAQNAESLSDFIHKMKIAAKEADEVEYWLELCEHSKHLLSPTQELLDKLISIQKILSKIISSSKSKI